MGNLQRVQLDLDTRDAALLETAVQRVLQNMQDELVHTDDRELRSELRSDLERLEKIAACIMQARNAIPAAE
jgi:hypothetical protein